MTKPITPSQVGAAKATAIPHEVIRAFNELIAANCVNGRSVVKQSDVLDRMATLMRPAGFTDASEAARWRQSIFDVGYLNIEDLYRAAGWSVTYDKPGYNEPHYPATFTFSKP